MFFYNFFNIKLIRIFILFIIKLFFINQAVADVVMITPKDSEQEKLHLIHFKHKPFPKNYILTDNWYNFHSLVIITFFTLIGFIMLYFIRKRTRPNKRSSLKKTI